MGSPANPLAAAAGGGQGSPLSGILMSALGAKSGATDGEGGGDAAQEYAQQASELQGADPQLLLRQLNQIQKLLGVLFVQTIQRLPNVGNQISKVMTTMTKAIKEAQQAAQTNAAVQRPGVDFSAAAPGVGPQAGMEQAGKGQPGVGGA